MIHQIFENIVNQENVRQNLSKLRQALKDGTNKHALLYCIGSRHQVLIDLLESSDSKTRKNAALLMGDLGVDVYLQPLFEAYEKEDTLFVRSAYLTALKEYDYRPYLAKLKEHLDELTTNEIPEESKKHILEEIRLLNELVIMMEGIKTHKFVGYEETSQLVLLTNRNHKNITLEQLEGMPAKSFNAGVIVKCKNLNDILKIRTYQEMLFMVEGMLTCPANAEEAAKMIVKSNFIPFLEKRHEGAAPFYFRVELKSKMELDKKSVFTKKLSSEIEQLSKRKLINSTSNYEVELRLIENKEGNFNVLVKLFTINDDRFSYRKNVIATSMKPVNAALTVELVKEYLKEDAQVLDPFCGVGTLLIERSKAVPAKTMYGIDIFGEAITKARENTVRAHQNVNYINRDYFDFVHDYLFDEIITDMPTVTGRKTENEISSLYSSFFSKSLEHLKDDGVVIMYSHNRELVRRMAPTKGFRILEEYEISMKEGTYVFVLKKKNV